MKLESVVPDAHTQFKHTCTADGPGVVPFSPMMRCHVRSPSHRTNQASITPTHHPITASAGPQTPPSPPRTCSAAVSEARSALRRYRESTAGTAPTTPGPRRVTFYLPQPSPESGDDLIRPFDEGEYPGGVRQRFRGLRPLVESLLEGYGSPEFLGMLESPADGIGCWTACDGGITLATLVTNATFNPFARLCAGDFGARVLDPGHLIAVVNPSWTTSKDVGQLWDRKLKAAAAALIDDSTAWTAVYHLEDIRTAAGALGLLERSFPGPWRLYPATVEEEGDAEGALVAEAAVLETAERPSREEIIAALNEAAKGRITKSGSGNKLKGWWGGL